MSIFFNFFDFFYNNLNSWIVYFWFLRYTRFAQIFSNILLKIVCILVAVAYFTIAERKIMAAIQRRKGPNVVGLWGLLQPLADGAKLLIKELIIPTRANSTIFLFAPLMVLILSIVSWIIIPSYSYLQIIDESWKKETRIYSENIYYNWHFLDHSVSAFFDYLNGPMITTYTSLNNVCYNWVLSFANLNYGVLFTLAISGLNVYGIIIAGWASNSKYAFLGSLRSSAQMISYEVSLTLLLLPVILLAGSLNWTEIVIAQSQKGWFILPLFPCAILFFISMLAETNRAPFDLPEAEAELVAGYNVEYSSIVFAMFFLGEYSNMLLMSSIIVLLFFGGWLAPSFIFIFLPSAFYFSLKTIIFCFLFILVRAALPRYRYDQLMDLGWKTYLPFSFGFFIFSAGLLLLFNSLPFVFLDGTLLTCNYTENSFFQQ